MELCLGDAWVIVGSGGQCGSCNYDLEWFASKRPGTMLDKGNSSYYVFGKMAGA